MLGVPPSCLNWTWFGYTASTLLTASRLSEIEQTEQSTKIEASII